MLGLLWGSFLNVVIYRVPRDMSVVRPASHCPACGAPVRAWQNVPVFGWLLLGGRAACCKAKISPRYPLVEAVGGLLALAVLETNVLTLPPETSLGRSAAIWVAGFALALGLVAATFIDLEHLYIPDGITYGGAVLGLATSSFRGLAFVDSLIGAAAGFGAVWVPFILLYGLARGGKLGMGHGDAKLLMLAGAWFGWAGAAFVLGAGAVQGTLLLLPLLVFGVKLPEPEALVKEREELKRELETMSAEERAQVEKELAGDPLLEEPEDGWGKARLAFGPFLALAMLEHLLLGPDAPSKVIGWIGRLLG